MRRAFILSSGTNPKEFIQRRGRILRKAEGKTIADIYTLKFEDIASLKKNGKKFAQNLIDSINKSKDTVLENMRKN